MGGVWREGAREASDEDLLLLDLMQRGGPPPERRQGVVQYWKSLAERWGNAKGEQVKDSTWDALRKRWERIEKDHPALARTITGVCASPANKSGEEGAQ